MGKGGTCIWKRRARHPGIGVRLVLALHPVFLNSWQVPNRADGEDDHKAALAQNSKPQGILFEGLNTSVGMAITEKWLGTRCTSMIGRLAERQSWYELEGAKVFVALCRNHLSASTSSKCMRLSPPNFKCADLIALHS